MKALVSARAYDFCVVSDVETWRRLVFRAQRRPLPPDPLFFPEDDIEDPRVESFERVPDIVFVIVFVIVPVIVFDDVAFAFAPPTAAPIDSERRLPPS